jgi:hypothetical protein
LARAVTDKTKSLSIKTNVLRKTEAFFGIQKNKHYKCGRLQSEVKTTCLFTVPPPKKKERAA